MDRAEAVALLKQLVALNLALPTYVTLDEKNGVFTIVLKGECNIQAMNDFVAEKNLSIKMDKSNCTYTIYKP